MIASSPPAVAADRALTRSFCSLTTIPRFLLGVTAALRDRSRPSLVSTSSRPSGTTVGAARPRRRLPFGRAGGRVRSRGRRGGSDRQTVRGTWCLVEAEFPGAGRGLDAVVDRELLVDVVGVPLDAASREEQPLGDLRGGETRRDQAQDVPLSPRERIEPGSGLGRPGLR